jgi:hypothetical protein
MENGQAEVFGWRPQQQKAPPGVAGRGFYYSFEF